MATNYVTVPKTAENYDPNLKTQLLSGQGSPVAPQGPGITDQQKFQLSQFQGYGGTYEDWTKERAGYAEQAKQEMAANPAVVAGGYTPQTQAAAATAAPTAPATGLVGQAANPAPNTNPVGTFIKGLDWGNEGAAVSNVWNEAQKNGWTTKQIGDAMGFTEQQVQDAYSKYGYGAPKTNQPAQGLVNWNVTPTQTVQQQASDIVGADGALMQQARGRAMQQMNERGLVNSSLGIQAGQEAVLDRAIQIAQQDAATQAEAAKFNAGQGNAWTLAQQELAAKYDLAKFDVESRQALAATEREYQQQLATDKSFQDQYQMYVDALFKIDSDPELSAEAKTARKQEQLTLLRNYASIRGLNLDQYLNFGPATDTVDPATRTETATPGPVWTRSELTQT